MNFFKHLRIFFFLALLASGCQGAFSAKSLEEPILETALTWPDLLARFESGLFSLDRLDRKSSRLIEHSIRTLVQEERNWGRVEFLIERLNKSGNEDAYRLSLKLQIHLAMVQKSYGEAEKGLVSLIVKEPEERGPRLALAILYLRSAQFTKSIPLFNELLPEPRAVLGLIAAHRQLEDNDRVDTLCQKYREPIAEHWELTINCALFESQNMASPQKALDDLYASLALQNQSSEASLRLKEMISRIEASRSQVAEETR